MKKLAYTAFALVFLALGSSLANAQNSSTNASQEFSKKKATCITIILSGICMAAISPRKKTQSTITEKVMPKAPAPAREEILELAPNATRTAVKRYAEASPQFGGTFPYVWNFYKNPEVPSDGIIETLTGRVEGAGTPDESYVFTVAGTKHRYSYRNKNDKLAELLKGCLA